MRRTLLIILAFVPAVAAALIFRTWRDGNTGPPRSGNGEVAPAPTRDDVHAATGGAETFFIRMSTAVVDGVPRDYRGAYYYLDSWSRTEPERFEAEGTLVIVNPAPRTRSDLADLLIIRNDVSAERRRRRLDEAKGRYTSLRAGKALITGGRSIETANDILFHDGVEGHIADGKDGARPVDLKTSKAHVRLDNGHVSSIELAEDFEITRSDFELRGRGLVADDKAAIVVESSPELKLGRYQEERADGRVWRVELTAGGKLTYEPDASDEERGALERLRLGGGKVTAEDDVVLRVGDFALHADRMEGRISSRDETAGRTTRLESFVMSGHVRIVSEDGEVTGDHAVGGVLEGDAVDVVLEGSPVALTWSGARATDDPDAMARTIHASCRGRVHVRRPGPEDLETPLVVRLEDGVNVVIRRGEDVDLDLNGEALTLTISRLLANRPGARPDERAWRLTNAVAERDVSGTSRGSSFAAAKAELTRVHAATGLHTYDVLVLEKDATLVLERTPAKEDDPERAVRVEASERIEVMRAASPFDDSRVAASGRVNTRWEEAGELRHELDANSIEVVIGPRPVRVPESTRRRTRLKSFIAKTAVDFRHVTGSTLSGDVVRFSRERDEVIVEGAPARLVYDESEERRHVFAAEEIRVLRRAGRVTAAGSIEADVFMAALVLTAEQRAAEERADRELDERPSRDVKWRMTARELAASFTAGLPFDDRSGETRLRELELTGGVHIQNPTQTLDAERLFHDFHTRTGRGQGTPLVVTATRQRAGGSWIDRVQSERMTTNDEWTLFHGPCEAVFHVREEKGENLEPLDVKSEKDVLVKESEIYFGGRTHLARGPIGTPHLILDADSVVAHFARGRKPKSAKDLERLDAIGNVSFTRGKLVGTGDLAYFDQVQRRIVLKAREGRCRMVLRGFTTTNEMVTYDMDDETITGSRLEGVVRESIRKERR